MTGALIVAVMVAAAAALLVREEVVLRGDGDRMWRSLGALGSTIAHAPARILHPVSHSSEQWDEWDDATDDEADEPVADDTEPES